MNCVFCGAPLKYDGAKFCTKCGAQQPVQPSNRPSRQSETTWKSELGIVKKYMYWNIKPGEIARRINEAEFLLYENARGIIINDGTTAYIRSNGETLTAIHGGIYEFVPEDEIDNLLNTRYGGAVQGLKKAWKWVVGLVAGRKVSGNIEETNYDNLRSLDDVIRFAQGDNLFSIILKQDREFQLVFGETHDNVDDFGDLVPMIIRTKYHDAKMGVRAFFEITDFEKFAAYYLSDASSATTSCLAKVLSPLVRNTVQQVLVDVELKDTRVAQENIHCIEEQLFRINFHGISLKSIVEISADNEDLERMHQIARELYLSEQELEQLQRTNDFKNRLNTVENQQLLAEATDEVDLFRKLKKINKDGALEMEDLRKFYVVLTRDQRIFDAKMNLSEAQAYEEIDKSLKEMESTGLLRQEEIAILRDEINERSYKRGYAFSMMQVKDALELQKVQQGGEADLQMQRKMADIALKRVEDDFMIERHNRARDVNHADFVQQQEHERMAQDTENRQKEFEQNLQHRDLDHAMDIHQRLQQAQMDSIRQMADIDLKKQSQHDDHEFRKQQSAENLEARMQHDRLEQEAAIHRDAQDTIRQRMDHMSQMTAEQLNSEAMNRAQMENWSSEERIAYAQALAAQNIQGEKERNLREQMMEEKNRQMLEEQQRNTAMMQQNVQATMAAMERMFNRMSDNSTATSIQMMQERTAQKEEYRDELHRQQQRLDTNQDQALNYTTKQNIGRQARAAQSVQQQAASQSTPPANSSQPSQNSQSPSQPYASQQNVFSGSKAVAEEVETSPTHKCPNCGREYPLDDNYCPECGIVIA